MYKNLYKEKVFICNNDYEKKVFFSRADAEYWCYCNEGHMIEADLSYWS